MIPINKNDKNYADYITVVEVVTFSGEPLPFEFMDDGFERAVRAVRAAHARFKEHEAKDPPNDEQVREWTQSCFDNMNSSIATYIEQKKFGRLAMLRPDNYEDLGSREQWAVDKKLGLLDWKEDK